MGREQHELGPVGGPADGRRPRHRADGGRRVGRCRGSGVRGHRVVAPVVRHGGGGDRLGSSDDVDAPQDRVEPGVELGRRLGEHGDGVPVGPPGERGEVRGGVGVGGGEPAGRGHREQPLAHQPLPRDVGVVAFAVAALVVGSRVVRGEERQARGVRRPREGTHRPAADGDRLGLPAGRVQDVQPGGPTLGAVGEKREPAAVRGPRRSALAAAPAPPSRRTGTRRRPDDRDPHRALRVLAVAPVGARRPGHPGTVGGQRDLGRMPAGGDALGGELRPAGRWAQLGPGGLGRLDGLDGLGGHAGTLRRAEGVDSQH